MPGKLVRKFELPEDTKRLGKFACSLGNAPGQLHVMEGHLCFLGAITGKVQISLKDVSKVSKAKRFKMTPGSGHSLHVTAKGSTHEFNGIREREACLKTVLKACEMATGRLPEVADKSDKSGGVTPR